MGIVRNDVNGNGSGGSNTINRISTKNQLGSMGSNERVASSWRGPKEDRITRDDIIALMRFGCPLKKTYAKTSRARVTEDGPNSRFPMGPDFGRRIGLVWVTKEGDGLSLAPITCPETRD